MSKVQQIVNDKIKAQLQQALEMFEGEMVEHQLDWDEEGNTVPWNCIRRSIDVSVQNGVSGYKYKGINKWLQSYDNENFYFTLKKINELGGTLKKGSKARYLFVYIPPKIEEKEVDGKTERVWVKPPMMRYHKVFRWQDTEGLERPVVEEDKDNERASTLEEYLERVKAKGITWIETGNTINFDEDESIIYIPPLSRFESSDLYYATLLREIVKATSTEDRLDRWKSNKHTEAREELIAEVASATICLRYGLNVIPETAADVYKWLKALDDDQQLFTSAMTKAEQALAYLDK